jgi:hypothetical protein
MGLINAYKDMFDNVVSPIDLVVINHQNQTRINDLWDYIRYIWTRRRLVSRCRPCLALRQVRVCNAGSKWTTRRQEQQQSNGAVSFCLTSSCQLLLSANGVVSVLHFQWIS